MFMNLYDGSVHCSIRVIRSWLKKRAQFKKRKNEMKNKTVLYSLFIVMVFGSGVAACSDDSDNSDGVSTDSTVDTASGSTGDSASVVSSDSTRTGDSASTGTTDTTTSNISPTEHGIGASCGCTGETCAAFGIPVPNGGDGIVGCENVPADHPGKVVCLRTYAGDIATKTYFANGYCALQAVANCEGAAVICGSASFGDYNNMTSCPAGSVMLQKKVNASATLAALGGATMTATMDSKTCAQGCTTDADCRVGETDPEINNAPSQYACIDKDGVKFCYDPQNIREDTYTATAF